MNTLASGVLVLSWHTFTQMYTHVNNTANLKTTKLVLEIWLTHKKLSFPTTNNQNHQSKSCLNSLRRIGSELECLADLQAIPDVRLLLSSHRLGPEANSSLCFIDRSCLDCIGKNAIILKSQISLLPPKLLQQVFQKITFWTAANYRKEQRIQKGETENKQPRVSSC